MARRSESGSLLMLAAVGTIGYIALDNGVAGDQGKLLTAQLRNWWTSITGRLRLPAPDGASPGTPAARDDGSWAIVPAPSYRLVLQGLTDMGGFGPLVYDGEGNIRQDPASGGTNTYGPGGIYLLNGRTVQHVRGLDFLWLDTGRMWGWGDEG